MKVGNIPDLLFRVRNIPHRTGPLEFGRGLSPFLAFSGEI